VCAPNKRGKLLEKRNQLNKRRCRPAIKKKNTTEKVCLLQGNRGVEGVQICNTKMGKKRRMMLPIVGGRKRGSQKLEKQLGPIGNRGDVQVCWRGAGWVKGSGVMMQ